MIDTLVANLPQARCSQLPQQLGLKPKGFVYVTLHRPSNVDDRASLVRSWNNFRVCHGAFLWFSRSPTDTQYAQGVRSFPFRYHDSLWLTENARFVLTDSGGIQERVHTYLGTPV